MRRKGTAHHQSKPKSMQEGPPDLSKFKARQRHMKSCKGSEPIQMMFSGLNPSSSAHDPRDPKLTASLRHLEVRAVGERTQQHRMTKIGGFPRQSHAQRKAISNAR
ncbi:hypothetical protein RND71_015911 [Anisodus tanguticus]|uniref:Uncharacterized protein n=1 Tax=Anisodus tanguticus TaxID=243964 RepID=A0AAE1VC91_9SOLA|nr:hypothetical protein RND71_015911 [Anisodus tanguticus]